MNKKNLLKRIASVATELDMKGFTREAKQLDAMLLKLASENMEFDDSVPPFDQEFFLNENKPLQDAKDRTELVPLQLLRILSNRVHNLKLDLDGIIEYIAKNKETLYQEYAELNRDKTLEREVEWMENEYVKYRASTQKFIEINQSIFPHWDF